MARRKSPKPRAQPRLGVHHPFDKASGYAARYDPRGFLAWLAPGLATTTLFRQWANVRGLIDPDALERIGDTVAELDDLFDPNAPIAVPIEFQTIPEPSTIRRLLNYLSVFLMVLRRPGLDGPFVIFPAVVYLQGQLPASEIRAENANLPGVGLRFRPISLAVGEQDAESTVDRIETEELRPCVLFWVPLMINGGKPDIIQRWRRLAERLIPRWDWRNLGTVALLFADLVKRRAAWEQALEDWRVVESTLFREWTELAAQRGEARGEARGETRGQLRASRASVIAVLETKFGATLPPDLIERVNGEDDPAVLSAWLVRCVQTDSLEKTRAILGLAAPASNPADAPKARKAKASRKTRDD